MKAIAYQKSLPIEHPDSLRDIRLEEPALSGRDLLVEIKAVSVNPVDAKMRMRAEPPPGEWLVLGWDAAGIVRDVGPEASLFKSGDRVWYAGAINRQGTNSELHLVDERIVGRMPESLDFAQAAALPLTSITAWEVLFDRLEIRQDRETTGDSLLIIGASGGVGSIMVQLARQLTGLSVIATASRPQTREWLKKLGAHDVIDHSRPISEELKKTGIAEARYIVGLNKTDLHFEQIVESIAPQGKFALIDDPEPIDVRLLKRKSVSLHWELMFTRSLFTTPDMIKQHNLLDTVAALVDSGTLRTTVNQHFGAISAANLKRAHALLESGKACGKIVLEGF
ncbi:MAG: zinc-binding alcohol dehydrogenase family protein [Desulfocapsaceae bacterium]|jgi:zinc-binding alcohol dehydrogenase family protein|nr:zinc-binding alcohol dehydrogenase family protein [Desulfocapsaceae bacterium]